MLRDIAYEDESIVQYKSTVIIEHFEKEVGENARWDSKGNGSSFIPAGWLQLLFSAQTIISKKNLGFKVLFAFTDFIEKVSKEPLTESKVNGIEITDVTPIETYFEKDEYKILIVANKFPAEFDEPLLCAMYLDKIVKGLTPFKLFHG